MTIVGLEWSTALILFGWIPFWWAIAAITLYRMNQNDKRHHRSQMTTTDSSGGQR